MSSVLPMSIPAEALAAYVGVGVSAALAVVALIVSLKSLSIQKESARAAVIAAEAAQRANWLTEQRMLHEVSDARPHAGDATPAVPRSPHDGPFSEPADAEAGPRSDIRWSLDRKSKNSFVLRNVGTDVAEEVRIPPESAAQVSRGLPESATLRPQESVEFLMIGAFGAPIPNEIYVHWRGRDPDDPFVLAVPT